MQWWNDFVEWFYSETGWRVFSTAFLPFLSVLIAGLLAAGIARVSMNRALAKHDDEVRAAAVAALIEAGKSAASWSSLPAHEQDLRDAQANAASIRIRMMPLSGSSLASDWAEHMLADIRRDSAAFRMRAEQGSIDYRERLIEWYQRPSKAKKLFGADLERFATEDSTVDADLVERQRQWEAGQSVTGRQPIPGATINHGQHAGGAQATASPAVPPLVPSAAERAFTSTAAATPAAPTPPATPGAPTPPSAPTVPATPAPAAPTPAAPTPAAPAVPPVTLEAPPAAPTAFTSQTLGNAPAEATEIVEATIDEDPSA